MAYPDFFITGHPKCGTTALFKFLEQHPGIYMPSTKEPNFFAKDFCRDAEPGTFFYQMSPTEYLSLFDGAGPNQICGEASACYLYSPEAVHRIHEFNPDAKLIAIFREPVSFLRSLHLQLLKNESAREDVVDFQEALALEPRRKKGKEIPRRCLLPEFLYYSEWVQYSEQLKRVYRHFDREQVLVLIYEDFKQDNAGVYRTILEFIGADPSFSPRFGSYNRGGDRVKSRSMKEFLHEEGVFKWLKPATRAVIPPSVRKSLAAWFYRRFVFTTADPLSDHEKDRLKNKFRSEVEALEELMGQDLVAKWDY